MDPDWPDEALVAGAIRGEVRAAEQICVRYAPIVRRTLRHILGASAETHDLAQEVFLRVFQRLRTLRDPAALRNFVIGICFRLGRSQIRRKQIRSIVGFVPDFDEIPAPDAGDGARDAVRQLTRLLAGLSVQDRALFVSRYIDHMEVQEIAAVHRLSFSTARRRIHRMSKLVSARAEGDDILATYLRKPARRSVVLKPRLLSQNRQRSPSTTRTVAFSEENFR